MSYVLQDFEAPRKYSWYSVDEKPPET